MEEGSDREVHEKDAMDASYKKDENKKDKDDSENEKTNCGVNSEVNYESISNGKSSGSKTSTRGGRRRMKLSEKTGNVPLLSTSVGDKIQAKFRCQGRY